MNSVNVNSIKSDRLGRVALVIGTSVIGLFLGCLIAFFPWWFAIGFCLGPVVLVLMLRYPLWGAILALALIFEVIPSIFQPKLPVGAAELKPYDLIIMYLAMVIVFHAMINRINIREMIGRLWWPLIYLFACAGISLFYVKFFAPNKMALAEVRILIAWLLIPIILVGVNSKDKFKWFLRAVISISLVVSLYVTLQSMLDIRIMTSLRVEELDPTKNTGITRSLAGGGTYLIIFSLIYFLNRLMEKRISMLFAMPVIFLFVVGLAVTFGRGVWVATGVSLIFSAFLFKGWRGAVFASIVGTISVALLFTTLALVKPRLAEAIYERATGFATEVDKGDSFNWRKLENKQAMNSIESHPFFGVGIGGEYKKTMSSRGSFLNETTYIHNGYLYFPMKMGLIAALCPFALIFGFVLTYRDALVVPSIDRAFLAAVGGAFLAPVITSVTQPEWANVSGIAGFAVLISLMILYRIHGSFVDTPRAQK
jgi:O-antigen ligase